MAGGEQERGLGYTADGCHGVHGVLPSLEPGFPNYCKVSHSGYHISPTTGQTNFALINTLT